MTGQDDTRTFTYCPDCCTFEGPTTDGCCDVCDPLDGHSSGVRSLVPVAALDDLRADLAVAVRERDEARTVRGSWRRTAERLERERLIARAERDVALVKLKDTEAERDRLRQIGDQMQSESSRVAEWASGDEDLPYEVSMAVIAVRDCVEDWTAARAALAAPVPDPKEDDHR